jgi:POT family proton-dependent oligopeptide transporter
MCGGIGFYLTFRKADAQEDAMNNMKESEYLGGREVGDAENVETLSIRDEKNEKSGL